MTRADWIFRPILWFTIASTINVLLHEGAAMFAAVVPGVPSAIRAFGPVFSLVVGVCCWLAYRKMSRSAAGLPLLYLTAIGVAIFFGNLMSAAFAGDFPGVARWLELPMSARYAISAAGAAGDAAVMFWLGRQLRSWIPDKAGRTFGVIAVVVLPVVAGTALTILITQPVPPFMNFTGARIGEQSFAVFAVIGAATGARPSSAGRSFRLWWIDGTAAVATLLAVRIMALGIHV